MRYILRQREIVADDWAYAGEPVVATSAVVVPLAELRAEEARWRSWRGRLGVRLSPADAPEQLADLLPLLKLVAIEFPNAGDGRGYSQAHLLRARLEFHGELRAVGAGVKQDKVFLLARCGFDAMELAAGEDPEAARRALTRYTVGYQPGAPQAALRLQRYPAP